MSPLASKGCIIFANGKVQELSLTVPITNSLAFLFTVLGEWWAEGKVISRSEQSARAPHENGLGNGADCSRHLDWHGSCTERNRAVCEFQKLAANEPITLGFTCYLERLHSLPYEGWSERACIALDWTINDDFYDSKSTVRSSQH